MPCTPHPNQSQVLVIESEELEHAPVETAVSLYTFLGLPMLDYGSGDIESMLARTYVGLLEPQHVQALS